MPELVFGLVVVFHICQLTYAMQFIHQVSVLMHSVFAPVASIAEINDKTIVLGLASV